MLTPDDIDPFLDHLARHLAESGVDGGPVFAPYAAGTPWDREGRRPAMLELERWATPLDQPGWERVWAIPVDGRFVGHVDLHARPLATTLHRAVLGLGIELPFRGAGLGRRLMETAIGWAREEPRLDWLDLNVFAHNTPARALRRARLRRDRGHARPLPRRWAERGRHRDDAPRVTNGRPATPRGMLTLLFACLDAPDTGTPPATTDTGDLAADPDNPLRINELMADRTYFTTPPDPGLTGDWVELYNLSDVAVSLQGYNLTDSTGSTNWWPFPADTVIEARGWFFLWTCNGEVAETADPYAGICLKREGDALTLVDGTGDDVVRADHVAWGALDAPFSYARTVDGEGDWATDDTPTPGAANP